MAHPEPATPSRAVLVVDDDPLVLRSMERGLRRYGYEVHLAAGVDEAIEAADGLDLDAAIVDYSLPRGSGLDVLRVLRRTHPSCVRVLCTGRSELPIFVEAVNSGEVARVLRKPFPVQVMVDLLEEAFESAAERERYSTEQRERFTEAQRKALDEAVSPGHLGIALQPIVFVHGNRAKPRYYEALMRPHHPVFGSPAAVLQAAETQQRTAEVADRVLHAALASIARVPAGAGLFVNLHPDQLGAPDQLARSLAPYQAQAERITLEITERSRLQDIDGWDEAIRTAGDMGFSIAVDDLGAGYSSLSILADLRPQFIKIDMSLVRGAHLEPRKQRLLQLMATFGEATESGVIAEGVEELAEAEALANCGISLLQGYFFGRPTLETPDGAAFAFAGDPPLSGGMAGPR